MKKYPKGEYVTRRRLVILIVEIGVLVFILASNLDAISENIQINIVTSNIQASDDLKQLVIQELHQSCIKGNNTSEEDFQEHFNYYCSQFAPLAVYQYLLNNVTVRSDAYWEGSLSLDNDPQSTLKNGGDCENLAILALSMLKSYGYEGKIYFVFQPGHACWMVDYTMYGCSNDPIMAVKLIR